MMNKDKKIEQEIQKTLAQFEQPDKLPENPFFYTRVRQRLAGQSQRRRLIMVVLRPVFLTILVAMNLGSMLWYLRGRQQIEAETPRQELIEILADDLKMDNDQTKWFNFE